MALKDYRDVFTLEDYPPNDGRSEIPTEHVFDAMNEKFPNGYSFEPVAAGIASNGDAYFAGKLTVHDNDGSYTVTGSASGGIGLAGVATLAFRNAVLRGLGMAHTIYAQNTYENNTEDASAPQQDTRRYGNSQGGGSSQGSGSYRGRNSGSGGGNYGPWTGTAKVKSGEFEGTAYKDLPQEIIESWAEKGNNIAGLELERRQKDGGNRGGNGGSNNNTQRRNPFRRA